MKKLLLALLGLLIALPGMAFTFEHEGNTLEYTPNSDGTTCALTGGGASATGAVVIPETVTDPDSGTTYTVTSIADKVFQNNTVIESVVMPNTITSVGNSCFSSCSALASCQLSESLTEIADYTFYSCGKLTYIQIPEGVTAIGNNAFYSNVLRSITIPASVKKIGNYAFSSTITLKQVVILSSEISIQSNSFSNGTNSSDSAPSYVFYPSTITWPFYKWSTGCYYAYNQDEDVFEDGILYNSDKTIVYCISDINQKVILPNTVKKIESCAATYNYGLKKISIPESVKEIGEYAFQYARGLTSVELPAGLETIGRSAFQNTNIQDLTYLVLPNAKLIDYYAFAGITSLQFVLLGPDVSLGVYWSSSASFENCTGIKKFMYPSTKSKPSITGVPSSAYVAYAPDENLTDVKIEGDLVYSDDGSILVAMMPYYSEAEFEVPNTVTKIGSGAFVGCTGLESVTIPSTVTSIRDYAFQNLTNLSTLSLPASVETIGNYAFDGCKGIASDLAIPEKVTSIGNYAFRNCSKATGLSLPASLENIGIYAFYGCAGITSDLVIPSKVTSLGTDAFYGCSSIPSVTIPESITELPASVFYNCSSLTTANLPGNLTSIGSSAFYGCSKLAEVNLPETLTAINGSAFYNCKELNNITLPDNLATLGTNAFYGCTSLEAINIPEQITTIPNSAFQNCSALSSVSLSEGLVTVGQSAFNGCSALKSFDFPTSVTTIQANAFTGAGLEALFLAENIKTVGNKAFSNCLGLKSVFVGCSAILPTGTNNPFDGCTNIIKAAYPSTMTNPFTTALAVAYNPESANYKDGVVYGEGLETILFVRTDLEGDYHAPASVNEIGAYAFYGCDRLTDVVLAPTVSYIGTNAFQNSSLSTLAIGEDCTYIGANAFDGTELTDIYITAQTPPAIKSNSFANYNATVHVQGKEASRLYKKSKVGWANFKNYVLMDAPTDMTHSEERYVIGEPGDTFQLSAQLEGDDLDFPTIYWYSTDPEVATVDQTGLVTIMGEVEQPEEGEEVNPALLASDVDSTGEGGETGGGEEGVEEGGEELEDPVPAKPTCNIVARSLYSGFSYTVQVNDSEFEVETITLNYHEMTIEAGGTLQLEVTFEPTDATDKTITWTTSDESVATVDAGGLVTTLKPGNAIITATAGNGEEDECEITVVPVPTVEITAISLNHTEATLYPEDTLQLVVSYDPENATDKTITWSSSNTEVATVDENGLVTAHTDGSTVIMAITVNGINAECAVTVSKKAIPAEGIILSSEVEELTVGDTVELTATVTPVDTTDPTVTWTSSDEAVATVGEDGVVTAVGEGEATITATCGNVKAECTVIVSSTTTGIASVNGEDNAVKVISGEIVTAGAADVYTIDGRLAARSEDGRIKGLARGVYIVVTNSKSVKILL
ncbi:MAG: leucine-rich repeat protein [Barnesiella sp.]|nr:leucine-rich repeat protein [Barnesiella sp.]